MDMLPASEGSPCPGRRPREQPLGWQDQAMWCGLTSGHEALHWPGQTKVSEAEGDGRHQVELHHCPADGSNAITLLITAATLAAPSLALCTRLSALSLLTLARM